MRNNFIGKQIPKCVLSDGVVHAGVERDAEEADTG